MAKQKKKRTKKYTGADAAVDRPVITRVQAVSRSRLGQWWHDRRRVVRPIIIAAVVILVIVWLIIELVRALTHA